MIRLLITGLIACSLIACGDKSEEDIHFAIDPGESANGETLRLISYNILEGMTLDKTSNYNNFVEWIKTYDPDILALQEANKFTQASLEALATRYGHPYVVTNIKTGDNYPVALTSKYPINVRRKITKDVSHGAIFAEINGVNLVVLHLWPQAYWHVSNPSDGLGDAYRMQEITIYLDSTIRKYPTEKKWLMMGDFNSKSPIDSVSLAGAATTNFQLHRTIMQAGYSDALRYYRDVFQRSTPTVYGGWTGTQVGYYGSRIDFIYGTPTILRNLTKAKMLYDDFTDNKSDHYPVMVEFRY
ncbi:MAG: endonuclease/exonuclease/phosphatase family protein [Dysgonamonadaceae bacterium]|jgi:exodeoxyribonuclease-3|nr:endonuclease/exonuclease/phosphatase family protein [Dysgonamonadaceae bacterium]